MTSQSQPTSSKTWKYYNDLLLLLRPGVMICVSFTWFGFFSKLGQLPELTCHFRVQYFVIELIFLILLLAYLTGTKSFKEKRLEITLLLLSVLANGYAIWDVSKPIRQQTAGPHHFRMMQFNVNSKNRSFDKVFECIRANNPDIISFEEVDDAWGQELSAKLQDYPYRVVRPRPDNFGIAMFSKMPTRDAKVAAFGSANVPTVVGSFDLAGHAVSFVCTHTLPPMSIEYFNMRNEQMDLLAQAIKKAGSTTILAGDLNCTPWSYFFSQMLETSGLRDSRHGYGVQPSWPSLMVFLLIPIDHFLVSDDLVVLDRKVLGMVNSDHYPVLIDVAPAEEPGSASRR